MNWIYDKTYNCWVSVIKAQQGTKLVPHKIYYDKAQNFYFRQNSDGTQTRVQLTRDNKFSWKQPDGKTVRTRSSYKIKPEWPKATPSSVRVSENLWQFENSSDEGLKNGRYFPHRTKNGNLDVANGIDLGQNPQFLSEARNGITRDRANQVSSNVLSQEIQHIDRNLGRYTNRVDTISPQMKEGLLDMYWQVKNGLYKYDNLLQGIAEGNLPQIREESKVTFLNKQGKRQLDQRRWNARNEIYFHY